VPVVLFAAPPDDAHVAADDLLSDERAKRQQWSRLCRLVGNDDDEQALAGLGLDALDHQAFGRRETRRSMTRPCTSHVRCATVIAISSCTFSSITTRRRRASTAAN